MNMRLARPSVHGCFLQLCLGLRVGAFFLARDNTMIDPERHLHVAEFKVRLRPDDAALLKALARKGDLPPAVLARTLLLRELARRTQPSWLGGMSEGPVRATKQ